MIKLHKPEKGLRPITTGYNSITCNAQTYLKGFVDPMLSQCTYLVDSPAKFKERLLADLPKFDPEKHTIVSYDAVKLFTNVNTNRVVSHVLDTIYKSPDLYFKEKDEKGNRYPIPSRSDFRIFMQKVLKDFNVCQNNLGYYRQIGGLAMGSKLSGALSNLFIHLMEETVVSKLIKNKTIIHWQRFADDVLCICEKDSVDLILNKINAWDKNLNFKVEKLQNNEIKFLDSRIFLENKLLKFRKFFKRDENTVITNFSQSVSPYKYKVNNIFTQLHRTRDCSSDEEQFSIALNELRTIFANNSYPSRLVESKIAIFFINDKKPPRLEKINSFCLDYNSHMVDIIAKKLVKKMKNFAPDFSINTCYRSIKISNIYSYTFKPKIELMETANCIYHFQCECASNYIGQSKRRLRVRAGEHQQKCRKTSIYGHIISCKRYICLNINIPQMSW